MFIDVCLQKIKSNRCEKCLTRLIFYANAFLAKFQKSVLYKKKKKTLCTWN